MNFAEVNLLAGIAFTLVIIAFTLMYIAFWKKPRKSNK
jgi:cbb3-type cytochrome oxidase subunit 3